jgi:hypothetical protein
MRRGLKEYEKTSDCRPGRSIVKSISVYLAVIVCIAVAWPATVSAKLAASFIGAKTGTKTLHLDYSYSVNGDVILLELVQQGSGEVILASQEGTPPDAVLSLTGKQQLPLDEGVSYDFFWRVTRQTTGQPPETYIAEELNDVALGEAETGSLLFNETFSPPGADPRLIGSVSVPSGIELTMEDGIYSGGSVWVSGSLNLGTATVANSTDIYFLKPVTLNGHSNLRLIFNGGSEGSTVTGTGMDQDPAAKNDNLYVHIAADNITVSNVDGLSLNLPGTAGNARINTSRLKGGLALTDFATDASVYFSGVEFSSLTMSGSWSIQSTSAVFDCNGCRFQDGAIIGVHAFLPWFATFTDTIFERVVSVLGGAPSFDGCQFTSVTLKNRTAASFTNNVFTGTLYFDNAQSYEEVETPEWQASGSPSPTITGNSFVGHTAMSYPYYCGIPSQPCIDVKTGNFTPVSIGANYYGSKKGFLESPATGPSPNDFLGHHGARVYTKNPTDYNPDGNGFFQLAAAQSTGSFPNTDAPLPVFWARAVIAGQNALTHGWSSSGNGPLVQGKDTLISVDIGTTARSADGMKVRLTFNGREHEPEFEHPIKRDLADYGSATTIMYGGATFDFIVPGDDTHLASAAYEISLDTTDLDGYDRVPASKRGKQVLYSRNLNFTAPTTKTLKIDLIPAWLIGKGEGNAALFKPITQGLGASLLPLKSSGFDIKIQPSMWGTSLASFAGDTAFALLFFDWAVQIKALYAAQKVAGALGAAARIPDVIVVLLPENTLSIRTGGYIQLGNVIFVDEKDPMALFHELGHFFGMYKNPEQYDIDPTKYPFGYPLEGVTAFNTQNMTYGTGFTKVRQIHLPSPHDEWHAEQDWRDIMGSKNPAWIRPETLTSFIAGINSLSAATNQPLAGAAAAGNIATPQATNPPATGYRRILLSATARYEADIYRNAPVPGTMRAFDLTPIADQKIPDGDPCYFQLRTYDIWGTPINATNSAHCFEIPAPLAGDPVAPDGSFPWSATFDIPEETARLVVFTNWSYDTRTFLDINTANDLSLAITSPLAGDTLTTETQISWQTTGGPADPSSTTGQPLRFLVMYSSDSGTTWKLGQILEGNQLTMSAASLPVSDISSIKIIVTDGLRNAEARVDNLVVVERDPVVKILQPLDGDRAAPGDKWTLSALGFDMDGVNLTDSGTWTSSLDGDIGSGTGIEITTLSPGRHQLTFTVTDGKGNTDFDTVQITVSSNEDVDLFLSSDDLSIQAKDSYVPNQIVIDTPHNVTLTFRCPVTTTKGSLSLYMTPPGGSEELIDSHSFDLLRSETVTVFGEFTAAVEGVYHFRGKVLSTSPVDPQPANDERSWTFTTNSIKTLTGLKVTGPANVNENSTANYTAAAIWSDGSTSTVTSSASWSVNSPYTTISSSGVLTTEWVSANTSVTISASYTSGGITMTDTHNVTVVDGPPTLTGLTITGPANVNGNSTANYTATATWSNGSTSTVTSSASWSENSPYTTISSSGVLTTGSVSANTSVTISASYTSSGITRTDTHNVTVVDVFLALTQLTITGPANVNGNSTANYTATATWSDGSTSTVTSSASWSENSPCTTIGSLGVLTTGSVSASTSVTISASYTNGGLTLTDTLNVTVVNNIIEKEFPWLLFWPALMKNNL